MEKRSGEGVVSVNRACWQAALLGMWCRFTPRKVSCQPGADIACPIKELVAVLGAYMGPFCHNRVGLKAGCGIVLAERGMVPYFVCCSADAVNHRGAKMSAFSESRRVAYKRISCVFNKIQTRL